MDERVGRSLNNVRDFKALAQLEKNVRERRSFDSEIAAAFKTRAETIARDIIEQRTGLNLSQLTPAEEKIVRAVSEYLAIKSRDGSNASRTLTQLRNRGLIKAAETAVSKSKPTQGFQILHDEDLDDLSYEQIIIDHPEEFSERALWYSRRTLGIPNVSDRPPPDRSRLTEVPKIKSTDVATIDAVSDSKSPSRNPDWTREEHILGLDLYLRLHGTSYPDEHPEVIGLSQTLKKLAKLRNMTGTSTFRNANGVSMKMQNFRRVDPEYKGVGLPSGSRFEDEVWEQFAGSPETLTEAVDAIHYEILQADEASENSDLKHNHYWVLVSNPAKWAIDKFLESGVTKDTWGVRPSDAPKFAAGHLAIIRVGVDRRKAEERGGRNPLEPGIYAICEIEGPSYWGTGANDEYWAKNARRRPGWPTVGVRYLRNFLNCPLTIERLRTEMPHLSPLLLDGFQGASFPISSDDFHSVLGLLGEDRETIASDGPDEHATTFDKLAALESKYIHASPEVKTRVSKGIERGPIGGELKRANGYRCQLCEALGLNPIGFIKPNGEPYVEAHHVMPVHVKELGLLSASNIVTLCANHHREMHYGIVDTAIEEHHFKFKLAGIEIVIPRTKVKLRVGVLAYGSLMDDPGEEMRAVTIATFRNIETPMAVEYARSSVGRAGAPTLVPVENGGCKVRAWIYELSVDEKTASDILYRREIDKVGSGKEYAPPEPGNTKRVAIDRFLGLGGLHIVLSTRMAATITPLNPERLAKLAIESARTVLDGRDGISYLLNATKNGIATPLSDSYSNEILRILGASNLNEAIDLARVA